MKPNQNNTNWRIRLCVKHFIRRHLTISIHKVVCKASLLLCTVRVRVPNTYLQTYGIGTMSHPNSSTQQLKFFPIKGKGLNAKDQGGQDPFLFATCAELFHLQKAHQVNARTPSANFSPSKEAALCKRGEK